jgi:hypothetical protein
MSAFFEIPCLDAAVQKRLAEEIEGRVAAKKKDGVFSEHDVREIEVRLRPLADIRTSRPSTRTSSSAAGAESAPGGQPTPQRPP